MMSSFHTISDEHQEDEDLRCSGCSYFFSSITKPYLLPCNHNLCVICIDKLIKVSNTFCPICKTTFNKKDKNNFQVNYAFLNLVTKILKSKIILCKHCNKIYFWKDHYDKCEQSYFTDTNEILSEIKKLCEECFSIIKYLQYHKYILQTCKNEINETIQLSINNIQEKFKNKYSKFIEKLFTSNITQINIDNSRKEIIKFLEICKDYSNLFNKIDIKELENIIKKYNNSNNNELKNYMKSDNMKIKASKNLIENKINLSKKTNKSLPINNENNNNNNDDNNIEEDEDLTLTYEDEFQFNEISNEKTRHSAQPKINKINNDFQNQNNNFDDNQKSVFLIDDILDDINEPKIINKIIIGLNGVQVFSEKKNSNNLPENKYSGNNNINPLTQSMSNYLESKKFKKNNFDNIYNENNVKLTPRVKRNIEIINKRKFLYSQYKSNSNNIKIPNDKNNNSLENNSLINHYPNNSVEIKHNNNKKGENNEIQTMNKIVKNFNKIKDIINKMTKYTNENNNKNNILTNQIDINSKLINPKIVSDYCLLLNEISYNFHQSYNRFIISYIENTTIISLYDTRKSKFLTKDFKETLKEYPSLNYSLSIIFDDFDLFFISGGIEFSNYDSSNLLLSFRWSTMKIEFIEKMPKKRAFHSSIYFDNKLYIIGGMSEKNYYLNECYCFHITGKKWEKIPNLNISRLNPSLCIYNNNYLYVIRGNNKNESIDSIEFINIKNMINGWILFKPFDPGFSWFGCDTSLAITINQNQILIFGGRDKNGKLFHHSFILDPEKKTVYRGKDILISANFKFCGSIYQDKVIAIDWKNTTNIQNHGRHIYDLKKKKWFFEY